MNLRQTQTLRVFEDHDAGIGHVDADFDHGGRHQDMRIALFECRNRGLLCRSFHAPVHQAYIQLRQLLAERFVSHFGGLALQRLGLFDQGTDPVRLAAVGAGFRHPFDQAGALLFGNDRSGDRLAPRRQFVDLRIVEIGVDRHRHGARYRGRGHDQLVRHFAVAGLALQRQPLVDAEAMLLVEYDESEPVEFYAGLEQRMRADYDLRLARCDDRGFALALPALVGAHQVDHIDAQRLEPLQKVLVMLLCQDFGRRHQRRLVAGFDHRQAGQCRHHGLARTDIALHQPNHRLAGGEVLHQFAQHPLLRAS